MSVPEAIPLPEIRPRFEDFFRYCTPLDQARPDDLDKTRHKQNGGFVQMSEIYKSDIQGLNGLFGDRLLPRQIYEICVFHEEYKEYLIKILPRGYERFAVISDRDFNNMQELVAYIEELLNDPYDLLLFDISDLLNSGQAKDYAALRKSVQQFYDRLGALIKLGTTCVVFSGFAFYYQILTDVERPETVQIHIYPSEVDYFWEAQLVHPPEWYGRKSLFRPFHGEVPFPLRF